ncbi:finger 2 homolog [Octopus vulgaris]|uniref:Finger 2 homolog n=2 Tax=Octopus TaxID=6643 RepID=A0AA36BEU5_OCTVU|nr:zinc finger protein 2 homolog [Octopus sinensis]CAI9732748.1 finger 2 homolog [Octopus vulgaris]
MYPFPIYGVPTQRNFCNRTFALSPANLKQDTSKLIHSSPTMVSSESVLSTSQNCKTSAMKMNTKLNSSQAPNQIVGGQSSNMPYTPPKLFKCNTCEKVFAQKVNLQNHERTHTGQKPYVCLVCLKAFSQRTNLRNHERIHSGERPYICLVCSKSFSQRTNLRNHERIHSGERPYKCLTCSKAFSQLTNLRNHERIHTGIKPYTCSVCLKSFAQQAELTCHERVHTGIKPYTCSYCLKAFSQLTNLRNHERVHTKEKPFHCMMCPKAFSQRTDLRNHLRVHTREKPFACTVCPKAFAQRTDLKNHLRTHSGEKPYVCLVCGKAFSQVTNLRNHERIHSGEKPFVCLTCGKAFSQRSTLKNHERTHGLKLLKEQQCQNEDKKSNMIDSLQEVTRSEQSPTNNQNGYCSSKASSQHHDKTNTTTTNNNNNNTNNNNNSVAVEMPTAPSNSSDKNPLLCCICKKQFSQKSQFNNHVCVQGSMDEEIFFQQDPRSMASKQQNTSMFSKWMNACIQQQQQLQKEASSGTSSLPTSSCNENSITSPSSHLDSGLDSLWLLHGPDASNVGAASDLHRQMQMSSSAMKFQPAAIPSLMGSTYLPPMSPGWGSHYGWSRGFPMASPRWGPLTKNCSTSASQELKQNKQKEPKCCQKAASKSISSKLRQNSSS